MGEPGVRTIASLASETLERVGYGYVDLHLTKLCFFPFQRAIFYAVNLYWKRVLLELHVAKVI